VPSQPVVRQPEPSRPAVYDGLAEAA
jgi:hypothetical protein